ncbi:MAG: pilus assembly protein PilP [Methylococcales bacterium]|nr:pilus assembly protein PilP [Methylococcales bacterium]
MTLLCLIILSACSNDELEELNRSLNATTTTKVKSQIKPLPSVCEFKSFNYETKDQRNPFVAFKVTETTKLAAKDNIFKTLAPNSHRTKEILEAYPLNTLKMLGHVIYRNGFWALIKSADGELYRVTTGNYLGTNFGKVINITPDKVTVLELIQDQQNEWHEQNTTINLIQ